MLRMRKNKILKQQQREQATQQPAARRELSEGPMRPRAHAALPRRFAVRAAAATPSRPRATGASASGQLIEKRRGGGGGGPVMASGWMRESFFGGVNDVQ